MFASSPVRRRLVFRLRTKRRLVQTVHKHLLAINTSFIMQDQPLVQWSFLQYKRSNKAAVAPTACFLHSTTQIGSKILVYGGSDANGEGLGQLLIYDTASFLWSVPKDSIEFQEDHPGGRYGHSATLVEMHPPKVMIYGGMVNGGTFEFDAPNTPDGSQSPDRNIMSWRKRGKKSNSVEETDDAVYFLTLKADQWVWTKPLVHGGKESKPPARAEHSACKTGTNEVTVFGGCTDHPTNDMWAFNTADMEWKLCISSGIQPRPRYRHTAEVIGTKMFILGGSDNGEDVAEDSRYLSLHELNLETRQWSHPSISGSNPFPRSGHASSVVGAYSIAVFGGKRNNTIFLNDLILLDVQSYVGVTVRVVGSQLPSAVSNSSLTAVGNKLFVFGGTDVKNNCYTDIRTVDIGGYLSANDITVGAGASSDYSFKILIIGDAAVGKSSLLTRFSDNTFLPHYTSTIGIDFSSRMIRVDNAICKLEIWDTAGQERFATITASYYRGAQGALVVYDITSRDTFERAKVWYERARQLGGEDLETILVGNKIDLPNHKRQVSLEEGQALADELGIPFVETSAMNGSNVEAAFVYMTKNIKRSVDSKGLTGIKDKNLKNAGGVKLSSKEASAGVLGCRCG